MGSPERKHLKNVLNLSHSTTQTVVFFSCKDRQEQICTIQAQLTTLQMAFTYNRKYLKKSLDTSFPSTHVRICVKDARP